MKKTGLHPLVPPKMAKSTVNFDIVRDIGLKLPGVQESTACGARALKVQGQLSIRKLFANLAWLPEIKCEWTGVICEWFALEVIG